MDDLIKRSRNLFFTAGSPRNLESGENVDLSKLPKKFESIGFSENEANQLKQKINSTIEELTVGNVQTFFSPFVLEHQQRIADVSDLFASIMEKSLTSTEKEGKSLEIVLDIMESLDAQVSHPLLLERAKMHFFTHHPIGKKLSDSIPPLLHRHAHGILDNVEEIDAEQPIKYAGTADPADGLEWYREDPFLNEHHEHWHIVWEMRAMKKPGARRGGIVSVYAQTNAGQV